MKFRPLQPYFTVLLDFCQYAAARIKKEVNRKGYLSFVGGASLTKVELQCSKTFSAAPFYFTTYYHLYSWQTNVYKHIVRPKSRREFFLGCLAHLP